MNNKNKKLAVGALGLAVVLLGAYIVTKDSEDEVVNTQTYISRDHDFTFKMPKGYDYIEAKEPNSGRESIIISRVKDKNIPEAGEGPTAITIDVFTKPSTLDLEAWVQGNNISNFNLAVGDMEKTTVAGLSALSYQWDGLYRGQSVVFELDGSIILISGTYLETKDSIYSDFDKVVESFEF